MPLQTCPDPSVIKDRIRVAGQIFRLVQSVVLPLRTHTLLLWLLLSTGSILRCWLVAAAAPRGSIVIVISIRCCCCSSSPSFGFVVVVGNYNRFRTLLRWCRRIRIIIRIRIIHLPCSQCQCHDDDEFVVVVIVVVTYPYPNQYPNQRSCL
jgi:hypothetical protein